MSSLGLTDKPVAGIEFERLGMKDYVDAMSEFVRTCQTPMTIAIQGDWGTGKTSMMNMVKQDLSNGKMKIETRWFNTWQYAQFQEQDEIAISLLSGFMDELGDQARNARQALANIGKKATGFVSGLAKAVVDVGAGAGGDMVKDALDKLAESEMDAAKQLRNLKKDIEESVAAVLKKSGSERMVIFIDDLDRIVPARAVEILETIKLFMDVDKCVFILAVDYHVVSKGLEQKFGITMDDMKGKSFFDKIIQLPFNLPVAQYKIRDYMRELFKGAVDFSEDSLGILVRLAEYSIGTNPRSLKRLLNATQLLNIVAGKQGKLNADATANKEERQRILFAVLCLQLAYESVYGVLLRNAGALNQDFLDSLCDMDRIHDYQDVVDVLKKALPAGVEQAEFLSRFVGFMAAFKDAMQLESDDGGVNVISESEFEILRQFLMLSSITSTASLGVMSVGSVPANQTMVKRFFNEEFKSRYSDAISAFSGVFKEEYYRDSSYIGVEYVLGIYRFTLWFGWQQNRVVAYIGSSPDTPTKNIFHNYFKYEIGDKFPAMELRNLKSNDYIILDKDNVVDGDTEDSVFDKFVALVNSVMDRLLPELASLYSRKLPDINALLDLAANIKQQAITAFPSSDGWIVDGDLTSLHANKPVAIYKASWKDKFSIQINPDHNVLNNLYFGLRRVSKCPSFGSIEDEVIALCRDELFPEGGTLYLGNGNSNFFYKQLPAEVLHSYQGNLLSSEGKLSYDTPEKASIAVDKVIEILSRFKRIETKLDEMVSKFS
jgi:hypothetical protein